MQRKEDLSRTTVLVLLVLTVVVSALSTWILVSGLQANANAQDAFGNDNIGGIALKVVNPFPDQNQVGSPTQSGVGINILNPKGG